MATVLQPAIRQTAYGAFRKSGHPWAKLQSMKINLKELAIIGTVTANGVLLTSDRNVKENFTSLNPQAVLARVVSLPVREWNYKTEDQAQRHIGPLAQDFQAAFQLSADDKHISVVDEGGVALAAIQGLNQKLEAENAALKARLEKIERLLENPSLKRGNAPASSWIPARTQRHIVRKSCANWRRRGCCTRGYFLPVTHS